MSLEIEQREREGVILLDLKGRITMGEEAGIFRDAVEKIAAQPGARLILNMKEVALLFHFLRLPGRWHVHCRSGRKYRIPFQSQLISG